MSRIGRQPISIPAGVTCEVANRCVSVKGPKGSLSFGMPTGIEASLEAGVLSFENQLGPTNGCFHGLARARVATMVEGVATGFSKTLEIQGTGYNAQAAGKGVKLSVGFSNPRICEPPEGITVQITNPTEIIISGADKQSVGQFAAEIRSVRPPEPYKGKGIRYKGEAVRRKAGKSVS
ncbi:MAG: 50S ribosomal protein L6 [Planctomycetota bacterium]|nr:50S ribosomal protein L6 [Planctomycetota bacterium]